MFNSPLVRKRDARLLFDVMAYLVRRFGAPPQPSVPSPFNTAPILSNLSWHDTETRSIFDWAEDHFGLIKSDCYMSDFDIDLTPITKGLCKNQIAAARRLEVLAAGRMPYGRQKTSMLFYDPADCTLPGHFPVAMILRLAELRAQKFESEMPLSGHMQAMVKLTAAVYNRQGIGLSGGLSAVSTKLSEMHNTRPIARRVVINTLCFSTCLALRVRRQSVDQILGAYGPYMTKPMIQKIRQASHQIDKNREGLAVLQMLCERHAAPRTYGQIA